MAVILARTADEWEQPLRILMTDKGLQPDGSYLSVHKLPDGRVIESRCSIAGGRLHPTAEQRMSYDSKVLAAAGIDMRDFDLEE